MSDLVERLRGGPEWDFDGYKGFVLMQEAADEIERLRGAQQQVVSAWNAYMNANTFHRQAAMDDLSRAIIALEKEAALTTGE